MDVESYGRFQPNQGTKVLVMWFHIPEAQEIVLRVITLSAHSFSKERLLLRQITNGIKSKRASVTQADLFYYEPGAFSLASSRRSCGWIGLWLSRAMAMARQLGYRVFFCDRVPRHRLDADPCSGADLITRWLSSYAWASSG
jgi:hypothetical protein